MRSTSVLAPTWSQPDNAGQHPPPGLPPEQLQVQLLGGFRTSRDGTETRLPSCTWRLVAFLALTARPVERAHVASTLWLDKSEARAQANLRSCLWRLRQAEPEVVGGTPTHLHLGPLVQVDVHDLMRFARALADEDEVDLDAPEADALRWELLPDWYDDFVELEREHFRQIRFHALEMLALRLHRAGRTARALDIALTTLAAAPLRESAHRLVISLHLAEGNIAEAVRQYRSLCSLLARELGVDPSPALRRLVEPWLVPVRR